MNSHPLSAMKTGVARNSRYSTRYFHGWYRLVTPKIDAIYRPTVVPPGSNDLHCKIWEHTEQ